MRKNMMAALGLLALGMCTAFAGDDNVVSDLKRYAQIFPTIVDTAQPVISQDGSNQKWYRRKVSVGDVSFDVRRTDSLISPFAGEILFSCAVSVASAASEEALGSIKDSVDTFAGKCKATYAYQSSRWMRKSVSCTRYDGISALIVSPDSLGSTMYRCATFLPQD